MAKARITRSRKVLEEMEAEVVTEEGEEIIEERGDEIENLSLSVPVQETDNLQTGNTSSMEEFMKMMLKFSQDQKAQTLLFQEKFDSQSQEQKAQTSMLQEKFDSQLQEQKVQVQQLLQDQKSQYKALSQTLQSDMQNQAQLVQKKIDSQSEKIELLASKFDHIHLQLANYDDRIDSLSKEICNINEKLVLTESEHLEKSREAMKELTEVTKQETVEFVQQVEKKFIDQQDALADKLQQVSLEVQHITQKFSKHESQNLEVHECRSSESIASLDVPEFSKQFQCSMAAVDGSSASVGGPVKCEAVGEHHLCRSELRIPGLNFPSRLDLP